MKFDATNDATVHRVHAYYSDKPWPKSNGATNESGFTDISPSDYLPPSLFETALERTFSHNKMFHIFRGQAYLVWASSALYVAFVFLGPLLMRNRKPFNLKGPLAAWNLLLTLFSVMGMLRIMPHILYAFAINPPSYFLCRNGTQHSGEDAIYAWIVLFMWSKLAEFLDTAFLVLRKKPVNFLHWFHHASVAIYTWYSLSYQSSTGTLFAGMNYSVHTVMYFYYFLAAVGKPPNWGLFVTVIQISQMFIGIFINVAQFYVSTKYEHCDVAWQTFWPATAMYTVYLALFLKFFIGRYCFGGKKQHSE